MGRPRTALRLIGALLLAAALGAAWLLQRPAPGGPGAPPAPADTPSASPAGPLAPAEAMPSRPAASDLPPAPGPPPDENPRVSATARDFWRAGDYLAFVDRHLAEALDGDAEAAYFVAMAQRACIPAIGRPTLSGRAEAVEAWLARRPGLSDEQADVYRRSLHRCAGFVDAYAGEDDAETLDEAAENLLRAAAAAGHPAALVELRMWVAPGWRDAPGRDAVLDELAGAAASGHPEALRKLGDYLGGEAGTVLTLLACEAGYDCAPDADWVVEFCQLGWAVCGIEADGSEALLGSLPGYEATAVKERVASLRGGSAAAFRALLDTAVGREAVP